MGDVWEPGEDVLGPPEEDEFGDVDDDMDFDAEDELLRALDAGLTGPS